MLWSINDRKRVCEWRYRKDVYNNWCSTRYSVYRITEWELGDGTRSSTPAVVDAIKREASELPQCTAMCACMVTQSDSKCCHCCQAITYCIGYPFYCITIAESSQWLLIYCFNIQYVEGSFRLIIFMYITY